MINCIVLGRMSYTQDFSHREPNATKEAGSCMEGSDDGEDGATGGVIVVPRPEASIPLNPKCWFQISPLFPKNMFQMFTLFPKNF